MTNRQAPAALTQSAVSTPAAADLTATAAPIPQQMTAAAAPNAAARAVSGFLTAIGLAPSAPNGPKTPVGARTFLDSLTLIRRQLEHALVNRAPSLPNTPISLTVNQGASTTFTLPGTDGDGDRINYVVRQGPSHGAVAAPVYDAETDTYTVTYTAGAEAAGADQFAITGSDAASGFHLHGFASLFNSVQAHRDSVTVKVTVNAPPVVDPTQPFTPEPSRPGDPDGSVRGRINVTDPQGLPLSYAGSQTTTRGSVIVDDDGSFLYTPSDQARHDATADDAAQTGADTFQFTVTATSASGFTVTVGVSVPVTPSVNQAPTAPATVPDYTVNPSDGKVTGSIGYTDPENDTLTYTGPAAGKTAGGGSITVSPDGSFTYLPTAGQRHDAAGTGPTTDTFDVVINDGHGSVQTVAVAVTIDPTNRTPQPPATLPTGTVTDAHTGKTTGKVVFTDPDGDSLTYTGPASETTPGGGTITVEADGSFTYVPTPDQRHTAAADNAPAEAKRDTFTVTVDDGHGSIQTIAITVTIDPANQAPHAPATPPPSSVNSGTGEVTSAVGYTDGDGDTVTYSGPTTTAGGGSVTVNGDGSFSYTPTTAQRLAAYSTAGTDVDTFAVTLTDGHGSTQTVTVTVTIDPAGAAVTSTASTPGTGTIYTSVAPDGTHYALSWSGTGTAGSPYRSVVTITRPDGTTTTTAPIPGSPWLDVNASRPGTAVLVTLEGSTARVSAIHADGSVVTSAPVAGYPRSTVVGADGTIAMELTEGAATRIVVMSSDGTTVATDWVTRGGYYYNDRTAIVVGADGTVAKPIVSGTGTGPDPYQTRLLVIHRNADGSTTTTLSSPITGLAENAIVGADGTAGLVTEPVQDADSGHYQMYGVVVHADGTSTEFTTASDGWYWSDPAARLSIGADGTAAASSPSGAITIVRRDGSITSVNVSAGPVSVGGDGTAYVRSSSANTTVIRPDGAVDSLPGTVAVASDGTAYHSFRSDAQTVVTVIHEDGTTGPTVTLTGIPVGSVVFGPDGTAYQTTSGACGSTTCAHVTVIHPDGTSVGVISTSGTAWSPVEFGPDGILYLMAYNMTTAATTLTAFRPSDGTSRVSLPVAGTPQGDYRSGFTYRNVETMSDGSAVFTTSAGGTSTLAVLRPDGSTDVAPAGISGYVGNGPVRLSDGTIYQFVLGNGQTSVSVMRPDGSATTSQSVAGNPQMVLSFGPDGSFAFSSYTSASTPEGGTEYLARLTVVHADGSTLTSDPIAGTGGLVALGADGTAAMATDAGVLVLHADGTRTVTGPVDGYVSQRLDISQTGIVYHTLYASNESAAVVVIQPDGTISEPVVVSGLASAPVIDADGVAYLPTQLLNPSVASTFTVIQPDGSYSTQPAIAGFGPYFGGGFVVQADGTIYETTYAWASASSSDITTVRIFRPDGDLNTVTMTGSARGGVVIGPDGTLTQTTYDSASDTTFVHTITVVAPPPVEV